MNTYSDSINHLIEELAALPSIGAKSAQRLAFHILNMPQERVENLAGAITAAKKNVRYCKKCFTLTDQEICPICSDPKRDQKTIMVVEDTRDLAAYEKTGQYNGLYHVLQGAINPSLGITPADIRLKELMQRLQELRKMMEAQMNATGASDDEESDGESDDVELDLEDLELVGSSDDIAC